MNKGGCVTTSISLDKVKRHGGSTIRSHNPLTVETSPRQWGYAVSVPLRRPGDPFRVYAAPVLITVRVTVESGELGVLLVGEDLTTSLGTGPGPVPAGTHTVFVAWESGRSQGTLVFRNAGPGDRPCVFRVESVVLGEAPRLLLPPSPTGQKYVPDLFSQHRQSLRLVLEGDTITLHNQSQHVSDGHDFVTDTSQWGFSISLPLRIPIEPNARLQPIVAVDLHVAAGAVGVGLLDRDDDRFITPEIDSRAESHSTRIELRLPSGGIDTRLMIRNVFEGGSSRFRLLGITLGFAARTSALLAAQPVPEIGMIAHDAPLVTGVFDFLLSHSSRHWNSEQCDREYLRQRWAKPGRLEHLPPFDSLPPHAAPYYGLLSIFRVELSTHGISGRLLHHYVSSEKVVHAAVVGGRIVVAFDDGAAAFTRLETDECIAADSGQRLADPWFGGLHTVIPVDDTTCMVSSSGADAILWLDVTSDSVVRRWRLPQARYGTNYDLDSTTWLTEHYVANDFQLGHLNCASPDGRGGAFVSVLGQGDLLHVSATGDAKLLATGYVGCHGIRPFAGQSDSAYFCDSCSGRLMRVNGQGVQTLFETGSRWLHDAVQLTGGLFLMTLGDRNALILADVERGRALAEWDFSGAEGTVQFLNVANARIP